MISIQNVTYNYDKDITALANVDLNVADGEFIGIVGHNGSGKSTLARMMNGLLLPQSGKVAVDELVVGEDDIWEIRRRVAMIFQNPDNQIVGTTVREDVAFGAENLGVPGQELADRVDESLELAGISSLADAQPHLLSGGQKQLVAIAGALAMRPSYLILDEATSMLDFHGRAGISDVILNLKRSMGMAVIMITHFLEDLVHADRVAVMRKGKLAACSKPASLLGNIRNLTELGLEPLPISSFVQSLNERGFHISTDALTVQQVVNEICS